MRLRVNYVPHPGQRLFHDSGARHRVLACGARWGKDRACIAESIRLNVELGQLPRPDLIPRVHGWFVTPNYPLAQQLWRELKALTPTEVLAKSPLEKGYRLEWRNGAVVEVKSADDPTGLVAVGLDWVVLTEAGLLSPEAWDMALRPRLASPQRMGLAMFNGTPKGRNRYHEIYLRGQDPEQPDWESWNFPTAAVVGADGRLERHPYGNPHVSLEELERARRDMPARWFEQEFLAQFLSSEGAVFRNVRARVGPAPCPPEGPLIAGADLARRRDFTVFVLFDAQGRMVTMRRLQAIPYRQQAEAFASLIRDYDVKKAVVEANGPGDPFVEMLGATLYEQGVRCKVTPFDVTAASKRQLIEGLVVGFEQAQVTILDDPVLINELEAYTAEGTAGGHERFGAPAGFHDDCVMACALAWSQLAVKAKHRQSFSGLRSGRNALRKPAYRAGGGDHPVSRASRSAGQRLLREYVRADPPGRWKPAKNGLTRSTNIKLVYGDGRQRQEPG